MKIIWGSFLVVICTVLHSIESIDDHCVLKNRDIIVILASSDSINKPEFENAKISLVNFLSYFLISATDTRVSLIGFGHKASVEFSFTKYYNPAHMNFAIRLHKKIGGDAVLGGAMQLALTNVVPEMRSDVERIMLVISDGLNTDVIQPNIVAATLKANNIDIYSIGIGTNINSTQLKAISSKHEIDDFPNFKNLANVICKIPFTTGLYTGSTTPTVKSTTNVTETETTPTTTTEFRTTTEAVTNVTSPTTTERVTTTTPVIIPDCNVNKLDLIIALDASSSIARYWDQELTMANNIIESLNIGSNYSHVGLLLYSDMLEMSIRLEGHQNKTNIRETIRKLELLEGSTFIGNALRRCKEEFITKGRVGVNKTIILVTDGDDNSKEVDPIVEAENIKKLGIKIIVIGLGYSINKEQLNKMSSSESYYSIKDMNKIALFDTSMMASDICHIEKPKRICSAQLDIVFIIDASSQIPSKEWINQLLFTKGFIDRFDLGVNKTRFSLISFADEAMVEEAFTSNYTDLSNRITALNHTGGFTRIDKALNLASRSFYLNSFNSRKLVVLLSNGLSKELVQTIGASYDLQESGIDIMTIGVGNHSDGEELRLLASRSLSFLKTDVKDEKVFLDKIVKVACEPPAIVTSSFCPANGDIVFLVDQSTDITNEAWEGIKSLMLTTLYGFNVSKTLTNIAVIAFNDVAKTEFRLDDFYSKRDVYVAIKQLKRSGNGANLNLAIRRARQLFKISERADVAKVVVIISDKLPPNQKETLVEADNLKTDGVKILHIGLSKSSPYQFFTNLASPKSIINVENINEIDKNKAYVKDFICDVFKNRQDECKTKQLDVIMAIDKSSSLGPNNFRIQLNFINRIVENLDLRKDRTRLGVYTFNTLVDLNIPLDNNYDNSEMQREIIKIPFSEGMTAIGYVIGNATVHFIEKGRKNVPKVLVVLTDGANTEGEPPQIAGLHAKRYGIKIITIGVGDQISEKQLKDISTSGEFYNFKTFKDLEKSNAKTLSNDACQVPQKPTVCTAAGDLIYIVASGANKGTERFTQISNFMKSLTQLMLVDKENTRVATLKFNVGKYIDSGFQDNYDSFESSIDDLTSATNGTYVGKALARSKLLFDSDKRENATKTVIIISDSPIRDFKESVAQADQLKATKIKIFTIGLTGSASDTELRTIASPEKALFVDNFQNLSRFNSYISSELCEVIKGISKECSKRQLEIMFALDSSSSVGPKYWIDELGFVERIIRDMDLNNSLTRVGVVTFSTDAILEFGLNKFVDKYAIMSAVRQLPFNEGATAIGKALQECKSELLNNSRRDVPKVIILVTDGISTAGIAPEIESSIIKKLGIKIIVVGVGDSISPAQLNTISSTGNFYKILDRKDFEMYDTTDITRNSCEVGKNS